MVYYDYEEMSDFLKKYDICSEEIIKAMKEIDYEFENINSILETPKSKSEMPKIIEFMHEEIMKMQEEKKEYIDKINFGINTYHEVINQIKMIVGDQDV